MMLLASEAGDLCVVISTGAHFDQSSQLARGHPHHDVVLCFHDRFEHHPVELQRYEAVTHTVALFSSIRRLYRVSEHVHLLSATPLQDFGQGQEPR